MAAYREPMNMEAKSPEPSSPPHSPWHSPVPYLFGGLAAMLGLIAFALLILACSYWKLSGFLDGEEAEPDMEAGNAKHDGAQKPFPPMACEPKFLVIMPGQQKPTCLATPASSSRSSSFASGTCTCDLDGDRSMKIDKTLKQENQSRNMETQNASNNDYQNC